MLVKFSLFQVWEVTNSHKLLETLTNDKFHAFLYRHHYNIVKVSIWFPYWVQNLIKSRFVSLTSLIDCQNGFHKFKYRWSKLYLPCFIMVYYLLHLIIQAWRVLGEGFWERRVMYWRLVVISNLEQYHKSSQRDSKVCAVLLIAKWSFLSIIAKDMTKA